MLLEVEDVTVHYDTALLLNEVSIKTGAGEMVGLVGPNGAGKTTLFRTITGLVTWEKETTKGTSLDINMKGKIVFDGKEIQDLPPYKIVERGLVHCPERRRPFSEMTVRENLRAGAHLLNHEESEKNLEEVYELFPVLEKRSNQIAGKMSGGEQQMLAIGRALISQPKLLCIDEPSLGLAPKLKKAVFERIRKIQEKGITILLAEQDAKSAFKLVDRSYVISAGHIIREGTPDELLEDENLRETYLGL